MLGAVLSTWDVVINQQPEIHFVMELLCRGDVEDEEIMNERRKQIYRMLEAVNAIEEEKEGKGIGSPGCGALFTVAVGLFIQSTNIY